MTSIQSPETTTTHPTRPVHSRAMAITTMAASVMLLSVEGNTLCNWSLSNRPAWVLLTHISMDSRIVRVKCTVEHHFRD